jgi:hypothetical protein
MTKERLLAREIRAAPMLQQTLGGGRDAPIGTAGQVAPRIDMTPDLIDDRAVAVGLKRNAPWATAPLRLAAGAGPMNFDGRRPSTGGISSCCP